MMKNWNNRTKKNRTCFEAAMHLFKYRLQSESELRTKLKLRKYSLEEIEETIAKLKEYEYIDDESLANSLLESLKARKCYGNMYILQKMHQRGLHAAELLSEEDEKELAATLLAKKVKIDPKYKVDYRKAMAFLGRRGFSSASVSYALQQLDIDEDEY